MLRYVFAALLLVPQFLWGQTISISATDTVFCQGTSITATALGTGVTTPCYRWLVNGAITSTVSTLISPSFTNHDSIVCQLFNITYDTLLATSNSIIFTVDTFPDAGVITGEDKVCVGSTITLFAPVAGGSWGVSNNYASVTTGVIKGIRPDCFECCRAGVTNVSYAVSNSCGIDSAIHQVGVIPLPAVRADLGRNYDCMYERFPIYYPYCYTYSRFLVKESAPDHQTGDYIFVDTNYCGVHRYTYENFTHILRPPSPALSLSDSDICANTTSILLPGVTSNEYATTTWSASGGVVTTSNDTAYFTAAEPGEYKITVSSVLRLCYWPSYNASTTISVYTPTSASLPGGICRDSILYLQPFGNSISWTSLTPYIATITANKLTPIDTGLAIVVATSPAGCTDTSKIKVENCLQDGLIFPNPCISNFTVYVSDENRHSNLSVFDAVGRRLVVVSLPSNYTDINIDSFAPGIYFVHLTGGNFRQSTYRIHKL